jgi:hypothetical protein
MPTSHLGAEVTQVALTLAGIALVALLVSHSKGVTDIIESAGKTYGGLLSVVTLQSPYGNAFAS